MTTATAKVAKINAKEMPKAMKYNVLNTFGAGSCMVSKKAELIGLDRPSIYTPAIEQDYVFRKEILTDLVAWWTIGDGEGLFLTGPSGSGKSTLVRQVAARLQLPLQHMVGHGRLEFPEMVTTMIIKDGNTIPRLGPLARAMKFGHVFLYDEADLVDESTNAALNEVLQGRPLIIPETGECIKPHPLFKFIATGNSRGGVDETGGLYQGVIQQNMAFCERFWFVEVGYPSPDIERTILEKAQPGMRPEIIQKMIIVANDVRLAFMGESDAGSACEVTFSTRTLVRWANLMTYYQPLAKANVNPLMYSLERALLTRATATTQEFIKGVVQRVFGGVN